MSKKTMSKKTTSKKTNSYKSKVFVDREFENFMNSNDPEYVADNMGDFLGELKHTSAHLVCEGCIENKIPDEYKDSFYGLISDPVKFKLFYDLSISMSNTMKASSGTGFQTKVCKVLNCLFEKNCLDLRAETNGEFKNLLNEILKKKEKLKDLSPDIDIVVYNKGSVKVDSIKCIISVKTTARDRILQTLNSKNEIDTYGIKIPMFFVTSGWDNDLNNERCINRERVQNLDGTFVTSENTKEYGNIKKLSTIIEVFKERGWGS